MKKIISIFLLIILLLSSIHMSFNAHAMEDVIESFDFKTLSSYPMLKGEEDVLGKIRELEAVDETVNLNIYKHISENSRTTYLDMTYIILELLGESTNAKNLGIQNFGGNTLDIEVFTTRDYWNLGAIEYLITEGIILEDEIEILFDTTLEIEDEIESKVYNQMLEYDRYMYNDRLLTDAELLEIEENLRLLEDINYFWRQPIPKELGLVFIARALELEPVYQGEINNLYLIRDWQDITPRYTPLIEALLSETINNTNKTYYNYFKEAGIINDDLLRPKSYFNNRQFRDLFNIREEKTIDKSTNNSAQVVNIREFYYNGLRKKIITLKHPDGSLRDLYISPDEGMDIKIDLGDGWAFGDDLKTGDRIAYRSLPDKNIDEEDLKDVDDWLELIPEIVYASFIDEKETTLRGTIAYTNPNSREMIVTDFSGNNHFLIGNRSTNVTVESKPVTFNDLPYGMEVELTLFQNNILSIDGKNPIDPFLNGYIPPGERRKTGTVYTIDDNFLEIYIDGDIEGYRITSNTNIRKDNKFSSINDIKLGDRVIIDFDDIYSTEISNIYLSDSSKHITRIYRGEIANVRTRGNNTIVLNNVEYLNEGNWNKTDSYSKTFNTSENEFYINNQKLSADQLKNYNGSRVYIAVDSHYGRENIRKLNVESGSNMNFNASIEEVLINQEILRANNLNFSMNKGTIVVKEDRLISPSQISVGESSYLASSFNNGVRNLNLVKLQDSSPLEEKLDSSKIVIMKGNIQDIGEYSVTIGRLGYEIDYLEWASDSSGYRQKRGAERLILTENTYIYDSELEESIDVTPFMDSGHISLNDIEDRDIRDRLESSFYTGRSSYFVVRENIVNGEITRELLALNLTPHIPFYRGSVYTEFASLGRVDNVNVLENTLSVNNAFTWNSLNNTFERTNSFDVNLNKSVIILNGEAISGEEIYKIRSNQKVYLINNMQVSSEKDSYIVIIED